jgi:hypothetical protein
VKVIDLIELHDSVAELQREGDRVVVLLCPAYVHHWEHVGAGWIGTGRSQNARIEIGSGPEAISAFGPCEVSDGGLRVEDGQLDLIPAPFDSTGPVTARLDLVDGTSVTIQGTGVRIELIGASTDIEALPPEWAPNVDTV